MKLEVLMATTNRKSIEELRLTSKNIKRTTTITIANQVKEEIYEKTCHAKRNKEPETAKEVNLDKKVHHEVSGQVCHIQEKENIYMYSYNERGLSRNRNRLLEKSKEDICLISDDDVVYKKNFENIIIEQFSKYPDTDIITFQIETPKGEKYKSYSKESYRHYKRTILKVSSIEIAFKRKSIIDKKIKFDENFGLGSKCPTGEEVIFLMDCLEKGLKMRYVPIPIVIHPPTSSGNNLDKKMFAAKKVLFKRLFGYKHIIIYPLFYLKKCIRKSGSFIRGNKLTFL